jgi:hypothetical protein
MLETGALGPKADCLLQIATYGEADTHYQIWVGSFREGFSDACGRLVGAATMAGVRKAPRDETAGRFATALVRVYGDLAVAGD